MRSTIFWLGLYALVCCECLNARPLRITESHLRSGLPQASNLESFLAYYTVFSGLGDHPARGIPALPSTTFHSYYFSDNEAARLEAEQAGWIIIHLAGNASSSPVRAAMKSKDLKARPHISPYLLNYTYTVYLDSKRTVHDKGTLQLINQLPEHKQVVMRKHEFITGEVTAWTEYTHAMQQPRYAVQSSQMKACIEEKLEEGYNSTADVHYNTGYIIRYMRSSIVQDFNEQWYQLILDCGIECQVAMFFVRQAFDTIIYSAPADYKYM